MSMHLLTEDGFYIDEDIYADVETRQIIEKIGKADTTGDAFRRTDELFAIRRFLCEVADIGPLIFTPRLQAIIGSFGKGYVPVRSIYFDKPGGSNWFVAYHQDMTISVNKRGDYPGFNAWTIKHGQIAVQPPVEILERMFTIRIHLDDTDEGNGALRVVPGSHRNGVVRPESVDRTMESICKVERGGIMVMKPLLLHASGRTVGGRSRRVIHIEFSNDRLPEGLEWGEQF